MTSIINYKIYILIGLQRKLPSNQSSKESRVYEPSRNAKARLTSKECGTYRKAEAKRKKASFTCGKKFAIQ
jgi:hypothetical protein